MAADDRTVRRLPEARTKTPTRLRALPDATNNSGTDDLPPFVQAHAAGVARVATRLHEMLIAEMDRRQAEHIAQYHPKGDDDAD